MHEKSERFVPTAGKIVWFGALSLVLGAALNSVAPDTSTLELAIIDELGRTVPARVEIVTADGENHIAEDALWAGGDCRTATVYGDILEDVLKKQSLEVKNPFSKTTQFYSDGRSIIRLPAGMAKIRVFKGPEYKLATSEIEMPEGKTLQHTIELSRLANMPQRGWYSSDDHLHIARPTKEIDPYISKVMQAEDIHVANLLQMGRESTFETTPQYAHGPQSWYREGNYILATGQENPRSHFLGHTITLGAKEPLNNLETYLIYRLLWQKAVEQGAINGFAHLGTLANLGSHAGLPLVLPHGLMHFMEILQGNRPGYATWYDVLNLGFRVTPTAGTDYPCLPSLPGHERFYTRVDGPFDYQSWLDAVRQGRTFVTTGPLLDFTVNGQEIGSEITVDEATTVLIETTVRFDPAKDEILGLELVQNGNVVRSFPRIADTGEMHVKIEYPIEQTSWLALRGYGNRAVEFYLAHEFHVSTVHSAPIYVTVENMPPLTSQPAARAAARTWLAQLENLELRLGEENLQYFFELVERNKNSGDGISKELVSRNRTALLDEIAHAKEFFMKFLE